MVPTLPSESSRYNKKLKWYLKMSAVEDINQERRITFCLYESWEKIAGSSGLPALKNLQRQEIETFKSNLVLLDLRNGQDDPTFQVIGQDLIEDIDVSLVGRPLSEVPRRSMLSRVTDHYLEVLANKVPIAFEAEFVNRDGEKALYRGILLPFSDDNQNINFILGGVRWILAKDVTLDDDKPTIEELMRTIAEGRDELELEKDDEVSVMETAEDNIYPDPSQESFEDVCLKEEEQTESVNFDEVPSENEFINNLDEEVEEEDKVLSDEKVIFEEPHQQEDVLKNDNLVDQTTEEVLSDPQDHEELNKEIAEEDYLEIDGTTSFEEDFIEELTTDIDADIEKIEEPEIDLSSNELDLETTPDKNIGPEAPDEKISEEAVAIDAVEDEKPAKKKRKGSVIERSMEMLLGKNKKKDIFGHELRAAESKITLPKEPEESVEEDNEEQGENETELTSAEAETPIVTKEVSSDTEVNEFTTTPEETNVPSEPVTSDVELNTSEEDASVSFEDSLDITLDTPFEDDSLDDSSAHIDLPINETVAAPEELKTSSIEEESSDETLSAEVAENEESTISHDISENIPDLKENEDTEEQGLHELQESLRQIIRYIKKEDTHHNRSRDSLYNILTAIYKFHGVCEQSPQAYNELVAENGLKIQERAPFTPVLKICLGKDYDKTRLTEYAAALGIAKHMNVDVPDFHDFIKHFPGGIKGCVKEMRAIRKGLSSANLVQQTRTIEEARNVLKDMPVIGRIRLKKMIVSKDADEFCLLLAKRRGHDIDVLKVLDDQYTKIEPILKRAAFIKGNLKKEK